MDIGLLNLSPYVRRVSINISQATRSYIDPEYVFTYIKSGCGIFVLEGMEYKVKPGDMILMPPYMLHIVRPGPGEKIEQYVVHFDAFFNSGRTGPLLLDENMNFAKFRQNKRNKENVLADLPPFIDTEHSIQVIVEDIFLSLKNESEKKRTGYELIEKGKMLELLALYLRSSSKENPGSDKNVKSWRNIEKAIAFIHRNYMRAISLAELSAAAGLSLNYFCNLFSEYTGDSPHDYLNKFRIHKAKDLIAESDLNFTQIAELVGFSSIHVFSKVFSRMENITLTEYSARNRQ